MTDKSVVQDGDPAPAAPGRNDMARATQLRLYDVLETLPVYVALLGADYRMPFANRFFRERFGDSRGHRCHDYLFRREEPCGNCQTFIPMRTNQPHRWEWEGPDGRIYDIHDYPFTDSDGSPMIMETGIDVTEVKKAHEKLRRMNEQLEQKVAERTETLQRSVSRFELLADTAGDLLRAEDPQAQVESLCLRVMRHLDCQIFVNYLSVGNRLRLNASAGFSPEVAARLEWIERGEAVCGCVADQGTRIVAERIPEMRDPRCDLVRSLGIKAYCCHPLLGPRGAVLGTLSFGTRERETFHEDDVALMKAVADFVAAAMSRLRDQEILRNAISELARSNRDLEQFAYVSSHDLQEPLRMITAFSDLLKERYQDKLDDEGREIVGFVTEGATRMQALVNGLLAYSRVSGKHAGVERTPVRESVEGALSNLRAAVEATGARIEVGELPSLPADPFQLTQVFQNLIGNALKYRRPDVTPEIRITAERIGGEWRFRVGDNGIGLDPQFSARIFEIFQRLHTRDEYEGTGIGLSICKKIVEGCGGRIWVESEPGRGARFFFTLPA